MTSLMLRFYVDILVYNVIFWGLVQHLQVTFWPEQFVVPSSSTSTIKEIV